MASEVLKQIADDIKEVDRTIAEGEELVNFLKEVGEDYHQQENDLRALKIRRKKWQAALKNRGL